MKYILLIYGNESDGAQRMAPEGGALLKEYGAFTESIRQSGQFVAGERLKPVAEASTVKIRELFRNTGWVFQRAHGFAHDWNHQLARRCARRCWR